MPAFQVPSMQLMTKMSLPQDKIGVKTEVSFIIVFPDKSEQVFFFIYVQERCIPWMKQTKNFSKLCITYLVTKASSFSFGLDILVIRFDKT